MFFILVSRHLLAGSGQNESLFCEYHNNIPLYPSLSIEKTIVIQFELIFSTEE